MPDITITQSTLERLKEHAEPIEDTADSVILRALDALDRSGAASAAPQGSSDKVMMFGPNMQLPDVTHTRMLAASIDGRPIAKANWARVLRHVLPLAMSHYGGFEQLRRRCPVNIVARVKEDDGYRHLPSAGISYQGTNANDAANAIVALAKDIGVTLDVDFEWRDKEQAAHRGRRAHIHLPAPSSVA